ESRLETPRLAQREIEKRLADLLDLRQPLGGRQRRYARGPLIERVEHQRIDQRFLVREMPVDRHRCDVDLRRHVAQRQALEPVTVEGFAGGGQDPVARTHVYTVYMRGGRCKSPANRRRVSSPLPPAAGPRASVHTRRAPRKRSSSHIPRRYCFLGCPRRPCRWRWWER